VGGERGSFAPHKAVGGALPCSMVERAYSLADTAIDWPTPPNGKPPTIAWRDG